jgi:hypothetical protein
MDIDDDNVSAALRLRLDDPQTFQHPARTYLIVGSGVDASHGHAHTVRTFAGP